MKQHPKISIITPVYNAESTIAAAVHSVLSQDFTNFEHIIVDGGSTDSTLDKIGRFEHLVVHSGADRGQSDAMNTGFDISTGDIIGYLNADDIYLPGAFEKAIPYLEKGNPFVVGNVLMVSSDGSCYLNDPKIELTDMLRHWEKNAFCINPTGYFYHREVQQTIGGFSIDNHFSMDLEFLLASAQRFPFTKLSSPEPLGLFFLHPTSKTSQQANLNHTLWTPSSFPYLEQYIQQLPVKTQRSFKKAQKLGYHMQRHEQSIIELRKRTAEAPGLYQKIPLKTQLLARRIANRLAYYL